MKYNLKNRPKPQHHIAGPPVYDYLETTRWFEGFQKELQELEIPVVPKPSEEYQKGLDNALAYTKKEILGESDGE